MAKPEGIRCLHLVGATGEIRTAQYEGRDHLVVPVVAMVEGVVWAMNSDVPEFVAAEELAETPHQWNGRGCFAGHPAEEGRAVTANTPRTLEKSFGLIFDASSSERILKTRRLELQAWLDPAKAEAVGPEAVDVIKRLRAKERVEVSIGAYVEAEQIDGVHNGQEYHGAWHNIVSDHLAFLAADQEGACSVAAGCGAPRTAVKHLVTAQGIQRERTMADKNSIIKDRFLAVVRGAEGASDSDVRRAIDAALRAVEPGYMGIECVYPDDKQVIYFVSPKDEWKMKRRGYEMAKDGSATLADDAAEVEPETVYKPVAAAAKKVAPKLKSAAILPQPKAACGCEGDRKMEAKSKAEIIAALVTDKHSWFKDGDESLLEPASDARLDEFRSAVDANRALSGTITKLETENRNVSARLKVAEERLKTAESPMTEEEFIQRAPAPIKALLDARKAEEDAIRASLVSQLKDLGANTEDELKKMSINELKTLAAYARVEVPDFSGRGLPKERFASKAEDYTPPDPYALALKARREAAKVN